MASFQHATKQPRFTVLFSTRRREAPMPALALEGGLIQSSAHSYPSNPSPPCCKVKQFIFFSFLRLQALIYLIHA